MSRFSIRHDIDGWPICENGEPIGGSSTHRNAVLARLQALEESLKIAKTFERFCSYLIDHHEGDVITEENLQQWLHNMVQEDAKRSL